MSVEINAKFKELKIYTDRQQGEDKVNCPECSTRKPYKKPNSVYDKDLSINLDTGLYYCHRCLWKGSVVNNTKYDTTPLPQLKDPNQIKDQESEAIKEAYEWVFKERKIQTQVLLRNKVYVNLKPNGRKDKALCFNYMVGQQPTLIKYRFFNKEWTQQKGGTPVLYKLNDLATSTIGIITEGEFDALAYEQAGLLFAVSLPMGGIQPNDKEAEGKLKCLQYSHEFISHIQKWYISVDNDSVGERTKEELALRLGKDKCYVINYPSGCKDANDVLIKFGEEALLKCYEQAEPYPLQGIQFAKDFKDRLLDIYTFGYGSKLATGWGTFDNYLFNYRGLIITITGIPSHGKTTFLSEWMLRLAVNMGHKIAVFSPEHPFEGLIKKWIRQINCKYFDEGLYPRVSKEEINDSLDFINNHFFKIENQDDAENTVDFIIETANQLIQKYGIKHLVLDSWTKIDGTNAKDDQSETISIKKILNKLSKWSKKTGVNIFNVTHPRKMLAKGDNNYEIPSAYDAAGSAHFYNLTDIQLVVYRNRSKDRDNPVDETQIHIQKVKEDWWGKEGMIKFEFHRAGERFYEQDSPIGAEPFVIEELPDFIYKDY